MKAFDKLQVSRQPFNVGDKGIDGYFFALKEPLTTEEKQQVLDHVVKHAPHVFGANRMTDSNGLKVNNNNPNEKVKTMFLLTTLVNGAGSPAFVIDSQYGISKIRSTGDIEAIVTETVKKDGRKKKEEEPAAKKEEIKEPPVATTDSQVTGGQMDLAKLGEGADETVTEKGAEATSNNVDAKVAEKASAGSTKTEKAKPEAAKKSAPKKDAPKKNADKKK